MAQEERDRRRKRQREGIDVALQKGVVIGYPEYRDGQDLRVLTGAVMGERTHIESVRKQNGMK